MRHLLLASILAGAAALSASAATVQGVLMDKMCSQKAIAGGQKVAHDHTRECALMPPCQKSGYGVFTADGKFLTFDEKGNAEALKALQASKKVSDMMVKVDGTVEGETIKVSSLQLQ